MKIVTWNINSVRYRLELIKQFIEKYRPDVICLQETKVIDELFPLTIFNNLGFKHIIYSGGKSYNGVAILSKYKIESHFAIKLYNDDHRHVAAQIKGIEIHNFYVPAGGDIPDIVLNPKFKHKLAYIELIKNWFLINRRNQLDKIIITGDLNIAPHEHDVWSSKQLKNIVSHTDVERHVLLDLQNSCNFIDTGRYFIPYDQKFYTWWSYRNIDWQKSNRGRRLDHIWISQKMIKFLDSIETAIDVRRWSLPSDHVPFILNLNMSL